MERLLTMDEEQFIADMQAQVRRALIQVAHAVNNAPDGNVISGSEIAVRDAMVELQRLTFEKAVQMRVDSTESTFSPSKGPGGPSQAEQRAGAADGVERQRTDRVSSHPLVRRGRRKR
jgi:hypothetical protein